MIRQATFADRHRQERRFEAGQRVLVHRDHIGSRGSDGQPCAKLRRKWVGPFFVSEVLSPTTVKLSLPANIRVNPVFNVDVIKLYVESEQDDEEVQEDEEDQQEEEKPPPFIDAEGHERYVVAEVLRHKFHGKKTLYLVKWVGYKDPTWEPEEFLHDEEGREILPLKHYLGNSHR